MRLDRITTVFIQQRCPRNQPSCLIGRNNQSFGATGFCQDRFPHQVTYALKQFFDRRRIPFVLQVFDIFGILNQLALQILDGLVNRIGWPKINRTSPFDGVTQAA